MKSGIMKKKSKKVNAHIGKQQISLPDKLCDWIFEEVSNQVGEDFEEMEFELTIEVTNEIKEEVQLEPLSEFNKNLKKALDYDPKGKKQ